MSGKRFSARFPGLAVLLAVTLIGGVVVTMTAAAQEDNEGTVSLDNRMIGWQGKYFENASSPAGLGGYGQATHCLLPEEAPSCDQYSLNVDIPASHWDDNAGGVEITILPDPPAAGQEEDGNDNFDIYVYEGANPGDSAIPVTQSTTPGETAERVVVPNASGAYTVVVQARKVSQSAYQGGVRVESRPNAGGDVPPEPLSDKPCVDGKSAGIFPCEGYDLASFLPKEDFLTPAELNDIWGWTDPQTGKEYALVGQQDGTSFVDVTDPYAPRYLGRLNTGQGAPSGVLSAWRDVKVYANHAFIVSEEPGHGMQVFDLRQLRDADPADPGVFQEDLEKRYSFIGEGTVTDPAPGPLVFTGDNAHNIVINEESGFAYAVGTSTCNGGGLHMIDLGEPDGDGNLPKPEFAGCVTEDTTAGPAANDTGESYVHDAQCVNYDGPDTEHDGKEICFNSSQDTLTIVDVTDKDNPVQLSRRPYEKATYTHQGWLTEDGSHFLVDDELDETDRNDVPRTQTYVFNVEDLDDEPGDGGGGPELVNTHQGESTSIDHNQYIVDGLSYQSNYRSGLRVLDVSDPQNLNEVGFFDIYPRDDLAEFNGTWSNYPYFESGNIIVSGIEQGLFVLRPSAAPGDPGGGDPGGGDPGGGDPGGGDTGGGDTGGGDTGGSTGGGSTGGSATPGAVGGTSTEATKNRRMRAGFGRHRYGRVKRGSFPVQCRVRGGSGRQVCAATAKAGTLTVGRGRMTFARGRRSGTVRVRLNRAGRRLLARRSRGLSVRVLLSARDGTGLRASNSRRYRLRSAR